MDKKSIAILLVASSFASSTFANSFINKLITNHSSATPSILKTHKTIKQADRSYTNFSGTWIVDCGDGLRMSTVIKNDEEYITIDGDVSRIGQGLKGESESNDQWTSSDHTSYEWNADRSALIIKSVSISKSHYDNSTIQTYMDTFTLTMKNNQINLDGTWTWFEDVTQMEKPKTKHCVFIKKQ